MSMGPHAGRINRQQLLDQSVRVTGNTVVPLHFGEQLRIGAITRPAPVTLPRRLPFPKSAGRSRHGAPVRYRQAIASRQAR